MSGGAIEVNNVIYVIHRGGKIRGYLTLFIA